MLLLKQSTLVFVNYRLCKPIDGTNANDVSNLFESLIGNFEDIVQYNKDNKAFEGGKHDNVTIKTLCDIMAGDSEESSETSELDEMATFLKDTFLNRFDGGDAPPAKKTNLEKFANVNELYLKIHDQECFDVSYDEMIKELQNVNFNKNIGGRQWIYQTCTEFGWYQSSDQPGHPFLDHFPVQGRNILVESLLIPSVHFNIFVPSNNQHHKFPL